MSSEESQTQPPTQPQSSPWPASNGVVGTYDLHCHCGAIRFTMKLSPPLYAEETQGKERYTAVECNCSHCERVGTIAVHPLAADVQFTQGLEHRKEYLCAKKKNPHWICDRCGCSVGADLTWVMKEMFHTEPRYMINLRMLKDYDPERLSVRKETAMKQMGPKYEV